MPPTYDYYDPEGVLAADIFGRRGSCPTKSALLSYRRLAEIFFIFYFSSGSFNPGQFRIHTDSFVHQHSALLHHPHTEYLPRRRKIRV
jgi:hypothetical protein